MFDIYFMKTNKELEEELRKMANQYWSLQQEVKVFLDAAEVVHDYDRVKQSESIYREEFAKSVEACAWMHEDKTLGITIGARITVDGVLALKRQRDNLRSLMVRIYNSGYHAGHHDTVESQYVDIHDCDMDTYHSETVADILSNVPDEVSLPASGTKAGPAGDVPEVAKPQGLAPSACSHLCFTDSGHSDVADTPESGTPQECPGWPPAEPPEHGRGWPPSSQPHPISHVSESDSESCRTGQCNTEPTDPQQHQ